MKDLIFRGYNRDGSLVTGDPSIAESEGFEWTLCPPNVFRFLSSRYVDAFFQDASLQLSSFKQFSKHTDEQRMDADEGLIYFVHRTNQGEGQTLIAKSRHGQAAYVLCGSIRYSEEAIQPFHADSYIRINETLPFGLAVARQIPGCTAGYEGLCLYQEKRLVERDLGSLDLSRFENTGNDKEKQKELNAFILSQVGHLRYFLKHRHRSFAHQCEYRFVWLTNSRVEDVLNIRVPEARRYCSRPNKMTE